MSPLTVLGYTVTQYDFTIKLAFINYCYLLLVLNYIIFTYSSLLTMI